ncbi:MAG TPA: SPOR domain-containing protein [Flavobacteriia bacterium]|jgi:hypothetical protein|nr:SPOR domain-containing protein [Flavobacteriia bacterium]
MKTLLLKYTFIVTVISLFCSTKLIAQNEGVVRIHSSDKIKQIISKKKAYNKRTKKVKGYKIQLFYGNERAAYKVRDKFLEAFPDTPIEIRFFSPEWKVWVGSYKTRLEADRAKKTFEEASFNPFVFQTEIKI